MGNDGAQAKSWHTALRNRRSRFSSCRLGRNRKCLWVCGRHPRLKYRRGAASLRTTFVLEPHYARCFNYYNILYSAVWNHIFCFILTYHIRVGATLSVLWGGWTELNWTELNWTERSGAKSAAYSGGQGFGRQVGYSLHIPYTIGNVSGCGRHPRLKYRRGASCLLTTFS